jgi:hypothetical protein
MGDPAVDLLNSIKKELAPRDKDNAFVPLVMKGKAPKAALAALGVEELSIVDSDRRAFLTLATHSTTSAAIDFYMNLAQGESLALAELPAYIAACGWDAGQIAAYRHRPGCQSYPSYVAWLALNGDPVEAALAMLANFAAFGDYCSKIAAALRSQYGFDDAACGFFDFYATATPDLDALALTAVRDALAAGRTLSHALPYSQLLQHYELEFWSTLAGIRK